MAPRLPPAMIIESQIVDLRSASRASAFTLVELLCVIAVLITMSALVAPSVGGLLAPQKVRSATAKLAGVLEYARSLAISKRTYVYVGFAEVDSNSTLVGVVSSPSGDPDLASATIVCRPVTLEDIDLRDSSSLRSAVSIPEAATSSNPDDVASSELGSFPLKHDGATVQCTKAVRFSPSGTVSIRNSGASRFVQIGISPAERPESTNVSLIQIAGLTGAVSIYLP